MQPSIRIGVKPEDAACRIADAAAQDRLVLFIGAGISRNAGLPNWKELLEPAAQEMGGWDAWNNRSLPALAEAYQHTQGRRALVDLVTSRLNSADLPSETHRLLPELKPRHVFTTNYDRLLEKTFTQSEWKCIGSPGNASRLKTTERAIFHVHGHIDHLGDDDDALIVTESDYRNVGKTKSAFLERLRPHWQDSLLLFLGYGAGDEDLKAQAIAVREIFGQAHAARHLAVDLSECPHDGLLLSQWSPLQADVILAADLEGATPKEKIERFLQSCRSSIDRKIEETMQEKRNRDIGRTGIVAEVVATIEKKVELAWEFQPPSSLPPDLPDFTGRENLISRLEARLCSEDANDTGIWGVHGMGGVGKSALAERVANRLRRRNAFPDGYLWIKVGERSLSEVLADCCRAIGGPESGIEFQNPEKLQTALQRAWRGKRMLVVLDNCDRPERIPELITAFNGHKLLITTRVRSERIGWFPVDCLDRIDSLALLRAICPRLTNIPDEDLAALAIGRFGGLPLALRLAGTWLQVSARRTVAEYVHLLNEAGLRLLTRQSTSSTGLDHARANDIRACFAMSVDALNPTQNTAFKLLAMAGLDLPVAVAREWLRRAISDWTDRDCDDLFDALIAAALLEVGDGMRLKMHALLRDYGRDLIRDEPIPGIDAGMFAHMLLNTAKTTPCTHGELPWACTEATLIDEAIQEAVNSGAIGSAFALLSYSAVNWVHHGPLLPIERLSTALLNARPAINDEQRMRAHLLRADATLRLGSKNDAEEDLHTAKRLAEKIGRHDAAVRCLYLLKGSTAEAERKQKIRSTIRFVHSLESQPTEAQAMACRWIAHLGMDPSQIARFSFEDCLTKGAFFDAMIDIYWLLDCNKHISDNEKNSLLDKIIAWSEYLRYPEIQFEFEMLRVQDLLAKNNIPSAYTYALRLQASDLVKHSHENEIRITMAFAGILAAQAEYEPMKESRRILASINESIPSLSPSLKLRVALFRCEIELKEHGADKDDLAHFSRILSDLETKAKSESTIDNLLWCTMLQAASIWHFRIHHPTEIDHAKTLWSRIHATMLKFPYVGVTDIARVRQWMHTNGFDPPVESTHDAPYDLRPGWWIATDSLPERITLGDGTPMALFSPGCYAISRTTITDAKTCSRPHHVPEDVWAAWVGIACRFPSPGQWLPGFYIDIHPVTWRQYLKYCSDTGTPPAIAPPAQTYHERPVTGLTYEEANRYALWAGKRLPTAAEWSAALHGTTGRRFPWGDEIGRVDIDAGIESKLDLPDISFHPLTTFDEKKFSDLLQGSLSLSISEKIRVAQAIPTLSQFQIDALIEVFEDEAIEFEKLRPTEGEIIDRLAQENTVKLSFTSGIAPHDVMSIEGDESPEGVRDLLGGIKEWIDMSDSENPDNKWTFKVMGLLPSQRLLRAFDTAHLPERIKFPENEAFRLADATIGFRCVIPLIDGMPLPEELQRIYDEATPPD